MGLAALSEGAVVSSGLCRPPTIPFLCRVADHSPHPIPETGRTPAPPPAQRAVILTYLNM